MLTDRQKLTIKHLQNHQGITKPTDIISFCISKLKKPKMSGEARLRGHTRTTTRKHGIKHYQGIISFYAQGKNDT